jgi:hypothetical protein
MRMAFCRSQDEDLQRLQAHCARIDVFSFHHRFKLRGRCRSKPLKDRHCARADPAANVYLSDREYYTWRLSIIATMMRGRKHLLIAASSIITVTTLGRPRRSVG